LVLATGFDFSFDPPPFHERSLDKDGHRIFPAKRGCG